MHHALQHFRQVELGTRHKNVSTRRKLSGGKTCSDKGEMRGGDDKGGVRGKGDNGGVRG